MKKLKSVSEFKTFPTWFLTLTNPFSLVELASYLRVVALDFFLIQFLRKFKFIKIPIVHVDSPLDKKIPFNTRRIADYLSFVNYWIRPLGLLIQTLGRKRALPYVIEFFSLLKKAYLSAAEIYRFRLSTTNRPHYKRRIYFAAIHLLDPHYLCVPSLHITVVCLTYSFMREVFSKENYSAEQIDLWNKELYAGAVNIAETVLYVKQHSLNCVSAALYMSTKIFPSLFSKEDATGFLDSMFVKSRDINEEDKRRLIDYMKSLFLDFCSEGQSSSDWKEPVKEFLIKCEERADNG